MRFAPYLNSEVSLIQEVAEKKFYAHHQSTVSSAYANYLFTNTESLGTWEIEEYRLVYLSEYRPEQAIMEDWDTINPLEDYVVSSHPENLFYVPEVHEFQPQSMRNFFITQRIDTPVVLQQPRSKFRPTELLAHYRFVGMLSSHGSHRRTSIMLRSITATIVRDILLPNTSESPGVHKLSPVLTLLNRPRDIFVPVSEEDEEEDEDSQGLDPLMPLEWRYGFYHSYGGLTMDASLLTYTRIFELLSDHRPIFAMKTRKVDKMRFKHSRGKSGKYTVEWKYIPRYKRMDVVLRWLVDDVKFQKFPTFRARIERSLRNLLLSPHEHLVVRNRAYVHHNAYARYKNTLLRSLKRVQ